MQKKLIAIAVAGALFAPLAFAQGNVTISGRFVAGVDSYKLTGGTAVGESGLRISDGSSRIIFSGSEDLGGGLRGVFQLDSRLALDTATTGAGTVLYASGNSHIGLGGAFGTVRLGRQDLHYTELLPIESYRASLLQPLIGLGSMSQVNGNTIANGTRTPNVLWWDSPNWGGLTARVALSTSYSAAAPNEGLESVTDGPDGESFNIAVRWTGGPVTAGVSLWDAEAEGATTAGDQESFRVFGGFTFPFGLKVGLAFDHSEVTLANGASAVERDAFMIPLTFSVGPHNFYATIAMLDEADGPTSAATPTGADTDATAYTIGWDMALSKRTFIGAYYATVDNESAARYNLFSTGGPGAAGGQAGHPGTALGQDAKQISFSVAHSF